QRGKMLMKRRGHAHTHKEAFSQCQGLQMVKLPDHCSGKLSQLLNALALGAALPEGHFCLRDRDVMATGVTAALVDGRVHMQRRWLPSPDLLSLHLSLFQDLSLYQGCENGSVERQGIIRYGRAEIPKTLEGPVLIPGLLGAVRDQLVKAGIRSGGQEHRGTA